MRKLSHYGKYSVLAFSGGKNTHKAITESSNGIPIFTRSITHALEISKVTTLINQLMVIKRLHEAGHKIAVGMEMFQVPYQKVLDDYITGQIDETTFMKQ